MTKICLTCGDQFVTIKITQKFCSPICRYNDWANEHPNRIKIHRKAYKKRNWRKVLNTENARAKKKARQNWHTKICKNGDCKKEFLPDLKHKGQQVYCSKHCQAIWSHRWANITDYGRAKRRHDVGERKHRLRANGGHFTLKEWIEMKCKHKYTCVFCGQVEPKIKLTKDHIHPISKGGKHEAINIQPLCMDCNLKKRDKLFAASETAVIENLTLKMSGSEEVREPLQT